MSEVANLIEMILDDLGRVKIEATTILEKIKKAEKKLERMKVETNR